MTNLTNKLFLPVFMLLLSISPAAAHNDTFFNSPHRLELKPASFAEPGYRLAKSYWLGGADLDLNFKDEDDKTRCNSMGYFQEACRGNKSPLLKCPYNSAYFKCTCDTSIYRYSALNCPPGSYPDEDVCDDYSKGCICENNKIWSAEDNSCVGCLSDSDCTDGKECNNRECVNIDLCAGVNCTGGQSCNADTGQCECPSGEVFYENQCQAPNCTNGEVTCSGSTPVCAANGQCVECVSASDCGANEICSGNTCQTVDRCKDVSCSGGKSCVNGACVCPSGQVDNNGTCETPNCANGSITCGDGQTCNETTKVCEATTRDCQVGDIFYSDKTCSNTYLASKTPVGIVVDPQNRLLVDLTETNNIMAAPGMPGSVNGGFPQFINVGNEMPMNASECGLDNTIEIIDQTRNYSPAGICFQKTNSALEGGRWYVPATRELFRLIISGNLEKVNTMLQMLSQHLSTAKIIENKIWSSDEVRGDTAGANMLVYNPHGSSTALVPTAKNATDVYFRCMARYKCPEGSADCTITPLVVITNPMQGYVAGGAPCVPPYFQEIFAWNTNYTRCVWDESSGGGSTDPQKTPCQTNDSMYCSGNNCFCTTASSDLYYKNATYMGKIGNLGLVIIGQVGSTSSVSDAENQCNNFSRENFSNWRIPYTSDASNWSSIIWNVGHPYAKSGSLSVYWDGYGWNSQVSNNRWGTLYCTHNYSNIYRE